ncbi:hypothetical protein TGAM01_v202195 [Trichoderma gamsii]|uniref:Uncharacterized protein n=1 Tax=Trichoderma gamsii TaxID=398673 RepID=A0A2P4ZXR6_9HYPO|nr:hypothetical protein TGAM01_v202195 [Trichoderma gamsii]PON29087.1 hypothetical protein TGAM01_v202195 [Trichoderma gamsii]
MLHRQNSLETNGQNVSQWHSLLLESVQQPRHVFEPQRLTSLVPRTIVKSYRVHHALSSPNIILKLSRRDSPALRRPTHIEPFLKIYRPSKDRLQQQDYSTAFSTVRTAPQQSGIISGYNSEDILSMTSDKPDVPTHRPTMGILPRLDGERILEMTSSDVLSRGPFRLNQRPV